MMGTPLPEKLSTQKKRVITELVQGQEFATQLQTLLHKRCDEHGSFSAEELVVKILRSFDETLSVLSSCESRDVSQNQQETSCDDSPCFDDRRSEDSGESRKRPASKDKRGCYKRKKNSQTWAIVSATLDDGHAWRKYGQKEIINAKYPRSYYRCTHKYDQGCRATKQVQRLEDNSQMYQTTYIGNHTCSDTFKAPQMITNSDPWEAYIVASSGSNNNNIPSKQDQFPFSTLTIKQESKAESTPSTTDHDPTAGYLSSVDSIIWKDLMPLDQSSEPVVSTVYSCSETTSHGLEIDFGVRSVDFESSFCFDESEFF